MKIQFTTNITSTLFHFLESISEWDIHTRKNIKDYYLSEYNLSDYEKELINEYIKIRKKYPWTKLDSDFYLANNLEELEDNLFKRLEKRELHLMKEIISGFYPNIEKIFERWKPLLLERKREIEKEVFKDYFKKIIEEIINFYGPEEPLENLKVHLLVNPLEEHHGGGANIIPKKNISLEPLKLKESSPEIIKKDILVILHEATHLIQNGIKKEKWDQFVSLSGENNLNFNILNEAIIDSLVPQGYLAFKHNLIKEEKILQFLEIKEINKERESNPREYFKKSRQKLSAMIYPITKKQIDRGSAFLEGNYIEECIDQYLIMRKEK